MVIDFQGSNVSGYCSFILHKGTIIKCVNRRVRAPDGVFSCDGDGIKTSGCVYVSLLLHFKGNILWLFDPTCIIVGYRIVQSVRITIT